MPEADAMQHFHSQLSEAVKLAQQHRTSSASNLAELLYDQWYTPTINRPIINVRSAVLVAHLRASDASGSRFEPGWTVVDPRLAAQQIGRASSPWQVAATKDGEVRWVYPADFIYSGHVGLPPKPGVNVEISQRHDSLRALPGWWTTMSAAWQQSMTEPLLRIYWSIDVTAVCDLVNSLTDGLDPTLCYALKCPLEPNRFLRPDAVTLFFSASAWPKAREVLRAAHARVTYGLGQQTPAFTLRLAKGLALAEDPGNDSFGMSRCSILAEGIWPALSYPDESSITQAAIQALENYDLRMDAPYLNPGSEARYSW